LNYPRLAPGTLIELSKQTAVVVSDGGGETISVFTQDWVETVWPWKQGLMQCKVLRIPAPEISVAISDTSSSRWIVNTLLTALLRDPVDAVNDADYVSELLGVESDLALNDFKKTFSKSV